MTTPGTPQVDEDDLTPDTPDEPREPESQPAAPPFAPEDGAYQTIVSEYFGLRRAGADPLGAALITAAHLAFMGMASAAAHEQNPGGV